MAAPVFFRIDPKNGPFPIDDRPYTSSHSSTPMHYPGTSSSKRDRSKPTPKDIHTSKFRTSTAPLLSPGPSPSFPPDYDNQPLYHRRVRQTSETPSITSISSITSLNSSFSVAAPSTSLIRIRAPPALLPRTESHTLESDVLTTRHLSALGIPVPKIGKLLRDRQTGKLTAAILEKPPGVTLSSVQWGKNDDRWTTTRQQIAGYRQKVKGVRGPAFGTVAAVAAGRGRASWREGMAQMIEALLLDAEDAWVNLPSSQIRAALEAPSAWNFTLQSSHSHPVHPHLIISTLGSANRVLVDEETGNVVGLFGFGDAFYGDAECVREDTTQPTYVLWQALRTVVVESVRPSQGGGGQKLVDARVRLMKAVGELVSADGKAK